MLLILDNRKIIQNNNKWMEIYNKQTTKNIKLYRYNNQTLLCIMKLNELNINTSWQHNKVRAANQQQPATLQWNNLFCMQNCTDGGSLLSVMDFSTCLTTQSLVQLFAVATTGEYRTSIEKIKCKNFSFSPKIFNRNPFFSTRARTVQNALMDTYLLQYPNTHTNTPKKPTNNL